MSETSENGPQLAAAITVVPPSGAQVFANVVQECALSIPTMGKQTVVISPMTPDPRLLVNGKDSAQVTLSPQGEGKFNVTYRYGFKGVRPDLLINLVLKDDTMANIGNVDYTFVIREASFVIDSLHDFAVDKDDAAGDNFLEVELKVYDGSGALVSGDSVHLSTTAGNVHFYEQDGITDITQEDTSGDYPILYADYPVTAGATEAIAKLGAENVGIFPLHMTVQGTGIETDVKFVLADSAIVPGNLPALKTTFGATMNLAGAATTFIALPAYPDGVDPQATIVPLVNGNAVGPFNVTVEQLVTLGLELPKLPFTWSGVDGQTYDDVGYLSYLVQSDYSDVAKIQGTIKKFNINTTGGVNNGPDPSITKRTLPAPMVRKGVTVVNQSVIASNVLDVTIDLTGAPVQATDVGYLTVYVEGYASDQDTVITKRTTIPATFAVVAGLVAVPVDATTLQNFSNGAGRLQSKLKMDYYVVPGGAIPPAIRGAGPESTSGTRSAGSAGDPIETGEIDFEQLVAQRTYSKISAQWVVATL